MKNFNELYNLHFEKIFKFAYRLIADQAKAEDIAQDTFLKLYYHLRENKNIANPKSWLYKVASNLSINHIKRTKHYQEITREQLKDQNQDFNFEEDFERKERIKLVKKAVQKIPVRDRILLNLHYDGVSYKDIAEIINVSDTSVSKMLIRAINKVSKILKAEKLV